MLKFFSNFSAARIANWIFLLGYFVVFSTIGDWDRPKTNAGAGVITSDTFEYYSYITMTFISGDPFYQNWEEDPHWEHAWVQETPGGSERTIKMTMGMSMLYAPFFGIAHTYAKITGQKADGYSTPYQFGMIFSVLFWMGIGLYCLRKVLEKHFSSMVVLLTLIVLMLATNINWYLFVRVGITHPYTFSLSAILLFVVTRWYEAPSYRDTIIIGGLLGLMTLIRPVNILFSSIFLLWGLTSFEAAKGRLRLFLRQFKMIGLIALCAFLVLLPQFIFWKMTTGSFLYYTYHDEGFFFANPQFYQSLLGYRNGWLRYTPVMFLPLIGIPFLWFKLREWFWVVVTFIPLYIYVVVSWWCWWYIGYGNRAMIDAYAVLSLPLACLIATVWQGKTWRKVAMASIVLLFVAHNIFQTVQCRLDIIHISAMNEAAYWKTFLSLDRPEKYGEMLNYPNVRAAKLGVEVVDPK